jgi:hypothetical protein
MEAIGIEMQYFLVLLNVSVGARTRDPLCGKESRPPASPARTCDELLDLGQALSELVANLDEVLFRLDRGGLRLGVTRPKLANLCRQTLFSFEATVRLGQW